MTCHPRVDRWPASIRRAATEAVRLGRRIPKGRPDGPTRLVLDVRLPGEAASTFDENSADPSRGQDALPRDTNRLGSPELVFNPVAARATSSAWGDGAPMCSGATTGGSAVGARAPSRSLAEWDSTHFLAISPGFAGLVAGRRRSAHTQLQGGKIVARSGDHFTPLRLCRAGVRCCHQASITVAGAVK
jgi:hypothetical protein